MSEQDFTREMPAEARTARVIMFVQGGLILVIYLILLFLLASQGVAGSLTVLILLNLAWGFIIVGVAFNFGSGKRWVRIAALIVEGIIVFNAALTLFSGGNVAATLIGLILAIVVLYQLTRPAARGWFGA
ncbi:hypothetical protein AB0K60_31110 [Thermopolyspora sp. NPDC052614]|uniref:hypothetical protein n=1 Tax=Thermopolyspora sp. NPDC052614 TaxID=3155682 RepID=UPI00341D120A